MIDGVSWHRSRAGARAMWRRVRWVGPDGAAGTPHQTPDRPRPRHTPHQTPHRPRPHQTPHRPRPHQIARTRSPAPKATARSGMNTAGRAVTRRPIRGRNTHRLTGPYHRHTLWRKAHAVGGASAGRISRTTAATSLTLTFPIFPTKYIYPPIVAHTLPTVLSIYIPT